MRKNFPGYSGSYYLGLNTENVPGMGIVPGIAVSGELDHTTRLPISGFPFSFRPQLLTGYWQYMAYTTSDQGYVSILLSKWNIAASQRDTVAYTRYLLPGMVMAWTDFYIPLIYRDTAVPDSAMIILSSSGPSPVAYSFLWVDDLRFADSATLGISNRIAGQPEPSIYPNPTSGTATLRYASSKSEKITVVVCNITGSNVWSAELTTDAGKNNLPINLNGISPGVYFVKISDGLQTIVRRIIVEK